MASALDLRDLSVFFHTTSGSVPDGEVQALHDVSLSVDDGEIVGIVGESGSGKSVTALAVMGLLPPTISRTTGSARLHGRELLTLSAKQRSAARGRDISMIFQEPMTALDPVFRVGDQIVETIRAHQRTSRRAAEDRSRQVLRDVGIPDAAVRARAYPHQLSGGMRQRVMIAMALVTEPSVLIADEPTTALDVTVQAQILALLQQLSSEHGTTVLLITHDLGVVAEVCSRVYTMYAGEVVESSTVDEALVAPRHPYTSGLIQAIPAAERRRQPLYSIPGRVPPLSGMPEGCRFEPRCEHARAECRLPQETVRLGDRQVRCCRTAELTLPGTRSRAVP